jgi:hypothetical protein
MVDLARAGKSPRRCQRPIHPIIEIGLSISGHRSRADWFASAGHGFPGIEIRFQESEAAMRPNTAGDPPRALTLKESPVGPLFDERGIATRDRWAGEATENLQEEIENDPNRQQEIHASGGRRALCGRRDRRM